MQNSINSIINSLKRKPLKSHLPKVISNYYTIYINFMNKICVTVKKYF